MTYGTARQIARALREVAKTEREFTTLADRAEEAANAKDQKAAEVAWVAYLDATTR